MLSMSSSSRMASIFARGTMTSCTVISSMSNRLSRIERCLFGRKLRGLEHDGADLLGAQSGCAPSSCGRMRSSLSSGLSERVGGDRQQVHERRRYPRQQRASARPPGARCPRRCAAPSTLGHQLAEDDREVGDGDHHQAGGDEAARLGFQPLRRSQAASGAGEDRVADDAVQQADRGDADLDGGEKARRLARPA